MDKKLAKKYRHQKRPLYIPKYDLYVLATDRSFETGDAMYIASEFVNLSTEGIRHDPISVMYHYNNEFYPDYPDHEHSFDAIVADLIDMPVGFSVQKFSKEYSQQEISFLNELKKKLLNKEIS